MPYVFVGIGEMLVFLLRGFYRFLKPLVMPRNDRETINRLSFAIAILLESPWLNYLNNCKWTPLSL